MAFGRCGGSGDLFEALLDGLEGFRVYERFSAAGDLLAVPDVLADVGGAGQGLLEGGEAQLFTPAELLTPRASRARRISRMGTPAAYCSKT